MGLAWHEDRAVVTYRFSPNANRLWSKSLNGHFFVCERPSDRQWFVAQYKTPMSAPTCYDVSNPNLYLTRISPSANCLWLACSYSSSRRLCIPGPSLSSDMNSFANMPFRTRSFATFKNFLRNSAVFPSAVRIDCNTSEFGIDAVSNNRNILT